MTPKKGGILKKRPSKSHVREKKVFNVPTPEECITCRKSTPSNSASYKDAIDVVAGMEESSDWTDVCFHQHQQCNNSDCTCVVFPLDVSVEIAKGAQNIINDLVANGEVHVCNSDDVLSAASTPPSYTQ